MILIRSIFSKLLLSHLAVILVSSIALGLLMSYLVRAQVIEDKRSELLQKSDAMLRLITHGLNKGRYPSATQIETMGDLVGATIWIVDKNSTILAGQPPERWAKRPFRENSTKINDLFNGTPQSWARTNRQNVDPSITVAIPVPDTPVPTALFLYAPLTGINNTVNALQNLLLYSLVFGIVIAAVVGLVISRSLTRPIANISQAAHKFAKGDYDTRTTATANNEIGDLGCTFNNMAESLAHIEQNRRDFLANVSHELKTPITSIQALAETILDGLATRPEQQQRYLQTIVGETHRIGRLIGDLLDLSQLEAGELSIFATSLDVQTFLVTELDKHTARFDEKELILTLDLPETLPPVFADADRLSQVFTNLFSNAVRYAPAHSVITLLVRPIEQGVSFSIIDQGPGIPATDLPYIWDRFYRVDKSRARIDGGTGLGLAITKKLVQAMQGDISVESIVGQGATFTFTLPLDTGKAVHL